MTSVFDQQDTDFTYLQKTFFTYESEDIKKPSKLEYIFFVLLLGKVHYVWFYVCLTHVDTTQGFIFLTMISIKFLKVVG